MYDTHVTCPEIVAVKRLDQFQLGGGIVGDAFHEKEKEFALKTGWCCSVKINREKKSVWHFILQVFKR